MGTTAAAPIDVKIYSVAESDVTGMTAAEIMPILHGLAPEEMAHAGAAHTALGDRLEQIATRVAQHAHTLAQNWTGSAAQAAMVQFQALHDQMATLAQQASQTGAVLSWLGNEVLPKFKALPDPTPASPMATDAQIAAAAGEQVAGPGGAVAGSIGGTVVGAVSSLFGGNSHAQAEADHTAQQYLRALNGYLIQANEALPSPVGGSSLFGDGSPGAGSPSGGSPASAGGMVPASGGYPGAGTGTSQGSRTGSTAGAPRVGAVPAAGVPGATLSAVPGSGHGTVPGASSLPPSTGSLQGVAVPPGGSLPSSLGGSTGTSLPGSAGLGTGSPTGMPVIPNLSVSGGTAGGLDPDGDELPADAAPGEVSGEVPGVDSALNGEVVGVGTPADGVVGTQAVSADGSLAAGAEGSADDGMMGFPMGGSGAAQREKERRRKAWLDEDPDIWGLPADHVPPVIEGGG
jgi:uncharacterized protein YukE